MRERGKGIFLTFVFCLLAVTAEAANYTGWRLDGTAADTWPRHFRLATDAFSAESDGDRQALHALRASGSGQPSGAAFSALYARLREAAGEGVPIYLVDLRQESHGFVNDGVPVSWYAPHNWANLGCDAAAVSVREEEQLSALVGTEIHAVPLGNADTQRLTPYTDAFWMPLRRRHGRRRRASATFALPPPTSAFPSRKPWTRSCAFFRHCPRAHGSIFTVTPGTAAPRRILSFMTS